jgi:hypothetical protein
MERSKLTDLNEGVATEAGVVVSGVVVTAGPELEEVFFEGAAEHPIVRSPASYSMAFRPSNRSAK